MHTHIEIAVMFWTLCIPGIWTRKQTRTGADNNSTVNQKITSVPTSLQPLEVDKNSYIKGSEVKV